MGTGSPWICGFVLAGLNIGSLILQSFACFGKRCLCLVVFTIVLASTCKAITNKLGNLMYNLACWYYSVWLVRFVLGCVYDCVYEGRYGVS